MARPAIARIRYNSAITRMIARGIKLENIRALQLQDEEGGQYSRCKDALEEYKAQLAQQTKTENIEPTPQWFNDIVGSITQSVEKMWETISLENQKAVNDIVTTFREKETLLEVQRNEDIDQVVKLEAKIEELNGIISTANNKIDEFSIENAKLQGELTVKTDDLKTIETKIDIIQKEKTALSGDIKVVKATLDQCKQLEVTNIAKINDQAALIERIKDENKSLLHSTEIAEAREKSLNQHLADIKDELSKAHSEKSALSNDIKIIQDSAQKSAVEKQEAITKLEESLAKMTQVFSLEELKNKQLTAYTEELEKRLATTQGLSQG